LQLRAVVVELTLQKAAMRLLQVVVMRLLQVVVVKRLLQEVVVMRLLQEVVVMRLLQVGVVMRLLQVVVAMRLLQEVEVRLPLVAAMKLPQEEAVNLLVENLVGEFQALVTRVQLLPRSVGLKMEGPFLVLRATLTLLVETRSMLVS
jgi:hypothetical protein